VAFGKAVVLDRSAASDATVIASADRARELERAREALSLVATELEQIASDLREAGRHEEADIIETSVMMAGDPGLDASVLSLVMDAGRTAAAAMIDATEESARQLAQLADPVLAERADDVRSLGRRAAARASGVKPGTASGIIIAGSLGPADVAEIAANAKGVALAGGGVTAHAAIVARSLGLPMVVGIGEGVLDVHDGEEVVLDGDEGVLFRQPEHARVAAARLEAERRRSARQQAIASRIQLAQTTDGRRIRVLANAASVAEVAEALDQGAEGIGMLRTELLFLDSKAWPDQRQQATFLGLILAPLTGRVATVRLLDFGGDKTPPFLRGATARGIELLL